MPRRPADVPCFRHDGLGRSAITRRSTTARSEARAHRQQPVERAERVAPERAEALAPTDRVDRGVNGRREVRVRIKTGELGARIDPNLRAPIDAGACA